MIDPISTNQDRTVGICSGSAKEMNYIGKFKASLLKEFADKILAEMGDVQVYFHTKELKSEEGTYHLAAAFDDPESDIFVGASSCVDDFVVIDVPATVISGKKKERKKKVG